VSDELPELEMLWVVSPRTSAFQRADTLDAREIVTAWPGFRLLSDDEFRAHVGKRAQALLLEIEREGARWTNPAGLRCGKQPTRRDHVDGCASRRQLQPATRRRRWTPELRPTRPL
jgi:hypothetical protein